MLFLHVLFGFGSGNRTLIDLFGSGRTVKHCFGRSIPPLMGPLMEKQSFRQYIPFKIRISGFCSKLHKLSFSEVSIKDLQK